MAVAVDRGHGFQHLLRSDMCKLRSFSHFPDPVALGLDRSALSSSLRTAVATVKRSVSTPCLSVVDGDCELSRPRVEIIAGHGVQGIRALAVEAALAVASGAEPVSAPGGLGGAYYLCNRAGEKIALLKPVDEARTPIPGSSNGGVREAAAYLLDHDGFAGVPPTALVRISPARSASAMGRQPVRSKVASIQQFVPHEFDAGDLGPSSFSISSVHRIGILDIRVLNIDRHTGNILVRQERCAHRSGELEVKAEGRPVRRPAELVPVDHGLCLPESLEDPYFEWLHWPQARVPFSEAEYEYIRNLDPATDAALLRSQLPLLKECSIRILVICTIFLKMTAAAGLCLADIGDMMTRRLHGSEEEPSLLESLCARAISSLSLNPHSGGEMRNAALDRPFDVDAEERKDIYNAGKVFDLRSVLQNRPPTWKPPRPHRALLPIPSPPRSSLFPLHEEEGDGSHGPDVVDEDDETDGLVHSSGNDELLNKAALTRSVSVSVSVMKRSHDSRGISFRTMKEEEWEQFVERFESLLPQALESRKNMNLNTELGSSCRF